MVTLQYLTAIPGMPSTQLSATVYVGGLAGGTSSNALAACFAPKPIVHAVVIRTFGFVTFETSAEAAEAAEQELVIDGRAVHAALSHSRYRSVADGAAPRRDSGGRSSSVFIRVPGDLRHQSASAVQKSLASFLTSSGALAAAEHQHSSQARRRQSSKAISTAASCSQCAAARPKRRPC